MTGSKKVTIVSLRPGSTTWESRVVTLTTAIVLPEGSEAERESLGEPFDAFEVSDAQSELAEPGTGSQAIPPPIRRTSASRL